ncbi:MAG: GspE/PulE family protein [Candidatus Andersenbacteria bacterium]|nr:GspE/PulE family protein [bacterium]MDZ4225595.1 GspE/PulE family protein [Candidatus Andersenbacteria bacterium]
MSDREKELKKDLSAKLSALGGEQQERLARRRAQALDLPYINLTMFPIDPDVLEILPRSQAERAQAVLFYKQGKDVRVGAVNPVLSEVAETTALIKERLNVEPEIYVISHRGLRVALSRYRREQEVAGRPQGELEVAEEELGSFTKAIEDMKQLGQHISTLAPTEILSNVVAGAVKLGASDVHIEPREKEARLRYRIDGVLQDITTMPRTGWQMMLSRVKVLSGLKLNVHEVPQDGSFVLRVGKNTYDIRVSVLPGGDGENIVMRVLNRAAEAVGMEELGMKKRDFDTVMRELKRSNGMILITGPTGSGKTTSLASFLKGINNPDLKVITLEDPIEYHLTGIEQTEVDDAAGYTFAKGLRAILRQDPDVIMVGEIRDTETAETAMHAALTGHLVFSTLHTNDAPGAVPRLVDMGIKPFIIAPAINLIMAQRLVRVVCEHCGQEYVPDRALRDKIADAMAGVRWEVFDPAVWRDKQIKFKRAKGCAECNGTGYKGRVGIFEVMPIDGEVEELVLKSADGNRLREAALRAGMTTITQDGYLKVIEQITTVEEIERVTEE